MPRDRQIFGEKAIDAQNVIRMRKIIDLTPVMVKAFLESVDEVSSVDDVQMMFKEFERQCIKGLYDRMYKQFPYDANSRTARSTDVSERKIRYIVNN